MGSDPTPSAARRPRKSQRGSSPPRQQKRRSWEWGRAFSGFDDRRGEIFAQRGSKYYTRFAIQSANRSTGKIFNSVELGYNRGIRRGASCPWPPRTKWLKRKHKSLF